MPRRRKKFIDKKNAVSFHLVHRSQKDPLIADENAPTGVLLAAATNKPKAKKEEEMKYGIYYDDDYDYLRHLKDTDEICDWAPTERFKIDSRESMNTLPQLQNEELSSRSTSSEAQNLSDKGVMNLTLPSSVFGSELETGVGLLNKAVPLKGPRPDWDPDIVEALDDDFNFDDPGNQLEDDFILKANAPALSDKVGDDMEYDTDSEENDSEDDVASDDLNYSDECDDIVDRFSDEETKTQFTQYSMSSSVIHRNKGLSLLDDKFEKFFEQYDDAEIGALDQDDIDGNLTQQSLMFDNILDDFEKENAEVKMRDIVEKSEYAGQDEIADSSENEIIEVTVEEPKDKWDCESILSTYSTLYNHPKTISEPRKEKKIKLTSKIEVPEEALPTKGLTFKQIEQEFFDSRRQDRADTYRPKNETPEEKRLRKQAVKQERKERRIEKKTNKMSFNEERLRQQREELNAKKNYSGMSIS